jgi:hypothetical protein
MPEAMTPKEVNELLARAAVVDRRRGEVSKFEIEEWHAHAVAQRWTLLEAVAAMRAHYAASTEWLMPHHVNERIKADRRQPRRNGHLPELEAAPPATPERIAEIRTKALRDWCERTGRRKAVPEREERSAIDELRRLTDHLPLPRRELEQRTPEPVGAAGDHGKELTDQETR